MRRILGALFMMGIMALGQAQATKVKALKVKEIKVEGSVTMEEISRLLEENASLHTADVLNWEKEYPYKPEVHFRIAHANNEVWLKYYVRESHILAQKTETNSGVSRDSCVEFFFDPLADGHYYNFEVNCIGTVLCAYGPGRRGRQRVDKDTVHRLVVAKSTLGDQPFAEKIGDFEWEMTIKIPAEVMTHTPGLQLKGSTAKANFYKCGDDTQLRHYVTWNPVVADHPDYHRPEYFGLLFFE